MQHHCTVQLQPEHTYSGEGSLLHLIVRSCVFSFRQNPPPHTLTSERCRLLRLQVLRRRQSLQGGLAQSLQHHLCRPGQVVLGPPSGPGHQGTAGVQPAHTEGNATHVNKSSKLLPSLALKVLKFTHGFYSRHDRKTHSV